MALFFVDYDLRKAKNYQPLYDKLKDFNAVRVLESSWRFNRANTTASGLRDYFKQFVDADDGLTVTEGSDWATYKALGTPKQLELTLGAGGDVALGAAGPTPSYHSSGMTAALRHRPSVTGTYSSTSA